MRRILLSLLTVLVVLVVVAVPAAAQPTLNEVVGAVEADGFYVEAGADADSQALRDLVAEADGLAVVVLGADDVDGANFAADQVAAELDGQSTVLVVSPGEVGASSDPFEEPQLDAALEAALASFDDGGTTSDAARAFAQSLDLVASVDSSAPVATNEEPSSGGGGGRGFLVFLLIAALVIGGLFWLSKRKAKEVDTGEVDRARAEIRSQLEVVAHDIVEHEDEIEVSGNEKAIEYFRAANATYVQVSDEVTETTNLLDLAELNDDIDLARWQLEAAQALVEGRDVPPKPEPEKPAACFFDPTHKPGTHECTIRTEAGDKEVRVCKRCADQLAKGEKPEPRMIDVGGRRVPAAKAPRSHGGLGMGGLSIFEVILGGLSVLAGARGRSGRTPTNSRSASSGVGVDWGEMLPKRRPRGNTFGQDRQPSRPRGLPRTPASRRSGSSRRRRPSGGASSRSTARRRRR